MYFVLSGTVDVVKSETDLKTGKIYTQTVASLHGGDSFGELALLNRSLRTASAFCKTECRLLRVDRDDFEHVIKMAAEQELIGKYDFLRTCPTFQSMVHLPELKKIAELSHLKEYQQNALVLGDCENSEELYFIRKVLEMKTKLIYIMNDMDRDLVERFKLMNLYKLKCRMVTFKSNLSKTACC